MIGVVDFVDGVDERRNSVIFQDFGGFALGRFFPLPFACRCSLDPYRLGGSRNDELGELEMTIVAFFFGFGYACGRSFGNCRRGRQFAVIRYTDFQPVIAARCGSKRCFRLSVGRGGAADYFLSVFKQANMRVGNRPKLRLILRICAAPMKFYREIFLGCQQSVDRHARFCGRIS